MTAIQILHEIETLPSAEQHAVFSSLQERFTKAEPATGEVRYADIDQAMRVADRIFTDRAELFKKLAE